MMKINKLWNEVTETYSIHISEGTKTFRITFAGNLDLHWNISDETTDSKEVVKKMEITKENYSIYSLFEKLFSKIELCNIYNVDENDVFLFEDEEELRERIARLQSYNDDLKRTHMYKKLFHNNCIEWHSDDYCHEEGNIVKIKRKKESFELSFQKQIDDIYKSGYSVRFRNSGSFYDPFNIVFMEMYNELQKYDLEYHQIHMEEYLYQKKISSSRKH